MAQMRLCELPTLLRRGHLLLYPFCTALQQTCAATNLPVSSPSPNFFCVAFELATQPSDGVHSEEGVHRCVCACGRDDSGVSPRVGSGISVSTVSRHWTHTACPVLCFLMAPLQAAFILCAFHCHCPLVMYFPRLGRCARPQGGCASSWLFLGQGGSGSAAADVGRMSVLDVRTGGTSRMAGSVTGLWGSGDDCVYGVGGRMGGGSMGWW